MIQDKVLRPWQLFLARVLREKSYNLVGTNAMDRYKADMGGVVMRSRAGQRPRGRTPARSAGSRRGCCGPTSRAWQFPPYILRALRESVDLFRERQSRLRLA